MCRIKIISKLTLILFIFTSMFFSASAKEKDKITLIVGTSSAVSQAVNELMKIPEIADSYDIQYYSYEEVTEGSIDKKDIFSSRILILNTMNSEFAKYVSDNISLSKTKPYALYKGAAIDANTVSLDPKVMQYFRPSTKENIKNGILFLLARDCGVDVSYEKPETGSKPGISHPDSKKVFTTFEEYLDWYKKKGLFKNDSFWVGILSGAPEALIHSLEKNNINVLSVRWRSPEEAIKKFFMDENGNARVSVVCTGTFKFMDDAETDKKKRKLLDELGAPIINIISLPSQTVSEWREYSGGIAPKDITYQLCTPEVSGLIEPTAVSGKEIKNDKTGNEFSVYEPITENIEFLVKRIKAWRNLQAKPNKDKKVAVLYYSHAGKQSAIGASYLNTLRSLEGMLKRMREEGYTIEGDLPSEEEIINLILQSGRNIGSWAEGELDALIASNKVVRLPVSRYLEWYNEINEDYRKEVEAGWGKTEDSKSMFKGKYIIIPHVNLGNIIFLPQPGRGRGDDPVKMYHSTQIWPTHQYTATYLWLKKEFHADAVIHLGTHGTHEWLPGKGSGLSQSCAPEVLIQDLPNIYPYIVDDVGEGIQAKRRGRAVIIDHLIPALKKAGAFMEYRDLAGLINDYNDAMARNQDLAEEKFNRVSILIKKLGLDKDLLLDVIDDEAVEKVEHYIVELQEASMPYGLHTFGISPEGQELKEFSELIKEREKDLSLDEVKKNLSLCKLELDRLIAGLNGRYVPAGEGNDPLRNPDAIPTGKDFYGFDADKVPSKDAYSLGKKAADEMIEKHLKEKREYPDKIGVVVWSIETQRNEGVNESTVLYLLGMKPIWDKNDRVIGVEPIPGPVLKRPRIDAHIQTTGLYRDCFPNVILLMDEAVRKAAQLTDVENFIAKHSKKIKTYLLEKGYSEEDAEILSKVRVFAPRPGSYGAGPSGGLINASGLWEKDEEIAEVFMNWVSFGYGKHIWGKQIKSVYKKNLEDVKMTMLSRSSNLYRLLDTGGPHEWLGSLSLSVKTLSGEYPDVLISRQEDKRNPHIEDIETMLGKDLRSRLLNPKWIEGMKKENYDGAGMMEYGVENMWAWQVTVPHSVDDTKWEQVYEVYVEDKYDQNLKEFFDKSNPWAYQSINARMLEAVRKEYWDAPEKIKKNLAVEYAMSVIEKGAACCQHTCNNPALTQMVVNIISLPGMLSPELVNEFKAVMSKAVGMDLEKAIAERKALQEKLAQATKELKQDDSTVDAKGSGDDKAVKGREPEKDKIEGYEMVEEKKEDTKLTSSGAAWAVIVIVLGFMALLVTGLIRRNRSF